MPGVLENSRKEKKKKVYYSHLLAPVPFLEFLSLRQTHKVS